MLKSCTFIMLLLGSFSLSAQNVNALGDVEANTIGGKDQVEQVLQTQMTLPKVLLTPNFNENVTAYFHLDSVGNAINIEFDSGTNNLLRKETIRLMRFLKFKPVVNSKPKTAYYLSYHISTERYNKFQKQKSKLNPRKQLPADSSYVVYNKAERAPEYYKNGDEGLAEFITSEIEYPKIAIDKSIQGTVIMDFVVETNGLITGINIKQAVNGGCTEEALRLIKLTKWQPATLNNKLVRYKTTYPITFSLRNSAGTINSAQSLGQ